MPIEASFRFQRIFGPVAFTIIVICSCAMGFWTDSSMAVSANPPETFITVKTPQGALIRAELADTALKRAQGLMFREQLPDDRGMLFIFGDAQPWTFWMKNTKIPLDILWLDKNGTIIHIEANVPICTRVDDHCPRHYSYKQSWQVLELNAGIAEKLQLLPGSRLTITLPPQNHNPS